MRTSTPNELDERARAMDETRLRATLSERADLPVDSARDWRVVAPRLRFARQPARTPSRAASWLLDVWGRVQPRSWQGVAMAAFTCVALMGMSFGAIHWAGPFLVEKLAEIGREQLYTNVGQSRDDAGVKITVDKAYADPGNVYIAFRIQPDQPVAGAFTLATFDLTNLSGGSDGGANIQCAARANGSAAAQCVIDSAAFRPNADGKTLTLTLDIHALYRVTSNSSHRIAGDWRFVFTIPFHSKNLGPGGPYAQPSVAPR